MSKVVAEIMRKHIEELESYLKQPVFEDNMQLKRIIAERRNELRIFLKKSKIEEFQEITIPLEEWNKLSDIEKQEAIDAFGECVSPHKAK